MSDLSQDELKTIIDDWAEVSKGKSEPPVYVQAENMAEFSSSPEGIEYLKQERELEGEEWLYAVFAREEGYLREDFARNASINFVASSAYPDLDRSAKVNWVEKAGGLPKYIERIAKHLHYEAGKTIGIAIAIAVNMVKKMCATGHTNVGQAGAKARAQACAAVADWERKKKAGK